MITLLSHIFIKEYPDLSSPPPRRAYGMLCSIAGIFFNILLFAGKYFAGTLSGSVAITADAFNNLSDAGSSLITLLGFRFAGMKPDTHHPFGHGRFEYICGFVVSMAIILVGFELIQTSIGKILHPSAIESGLLTIFVLLASILIKLYMFYYNRKGSAKIDSSAMGAAAADSLSDVAATFVVLVSVLISKVTSLQVDGWCGVLVGLFILYTGFQSARETLNPLLGKAADPKLVKEIEEIVLSHDEIIGIHDLIIHDYGPGRFIISLHGEVSGSGDIYVIHDAIDRIEKELNEKLGCESCLHMDPIDTDDHAVSQMKQFLAEQIKTIDPRITIHDFRRVKGTTHTNLIFDAVIPYNFRLSDEETITTIKTLITSLWPDHIAVITIDKSFTGEE